MLTCQPERRANACHPGKGRNSREAWPVAQGDLVII